MHFCFILILPKSSWGYNAHNMALEDSWQRFQFSTPDKLSNRNRILNVVGRCPVDRRLSRYLFPRRMLTKVKLWRFWNLDYCLTWQHHQWPHEGVTHYLHSIVTNTQTTRQINTRAENITSLSQMIDRFSPDDAFCPGRESPPLINWSRKETMAYNLHLEAVFSLEARFYLCYVIMISGVQRINNYEIGVFFRK